jgi:hypothetical protein
MPTAFAECNENITYYTLIGVFQTLVGEGCEHLPELKKLALSYDASVLQDFPMETVRIANKLVKNWCTKHGLPYCMQQIEEQNWVSYDIYSLQVSLYVSSDCLFLYSLKLMKASEVNAPTRELKRAETVVRKRSAASIENASKRSRHEGGEDSLTDVVGTSNVRSKRREGGSMRREATQILSAAPGAISSRM